VTWRRIMALNKDSLAERLRPGAGDMVAVSGSFEARPHEKGNDTRVNFTLFTDRVISVHRPKRKRARPCDDPPAPVGAPFADDIPVFGDPPTKEGRTP
jgi:hypothetical protein